jgi:hypothetical protein
MNLPGYDAWKLMSPDDERPQDESRECQFCGAWPGIACLLEDDCIEGEHPPCYALGRYEERDPDTWREEREEAKRDRENDR